MPLTDTFLDVAPEDSLTIFPLCKPADEGMNLTYMVVLMFPPLGERESELANPDDEL